MCLGEVAFPSTRRGCRLYKAHAHQSHRGTKHAPATAIGEVCTQARRKKKVFVYELLWAQCGCSVVRPVLRGKCFGQITFPAIPKMRRGLRDPGGLQNIFRLEFGRLRMQRRCPGWPKTMFNGNSILGMACEFGMPKPSPQKCRVFYRHSHRNGATNAIHRLELERRCSLHACSNVRKGTRSRVFGSPRKRYGPHMAMCVTCSDFPSASLWSNVGACAAEKTRLAQKELFLYKDRRETDREVYQALCVRD